MSPANPGYQAPAVAVSSSLPKRKADTTVLIVPVVSPGDDDAKATVVANPFLDAEAVGEIEVALEALGGGRAEWPRWHVEQRRRHRVCPKRRRGPNARNGRRVGRRWP